MDQQNLSIVVAVNNRRILQNNLLRSPALADSAHQHQIIVKENFSTAGAAYNSGLDEARNDLVVFIHQDMYLPAKWIGQLLEAIRTLDAAGENWGVLGCSGVVPEQHTVVGEMYSTGLGVIGKRLDAPVPVDTLDEIVLVIRKSSGLRFDPDVPNFHMYGADICLEARSRGMGSFAFQGFCVHNTRQLLELPPDFKQAYRYVKRKWKRYLPIHTTCTVIERFDIELRRQWKDVLIDRLFNGPRVAAPRMDNPRSIFRSDDEIAENVIELQTEPEQAAV
jgi:glycosyltransferase involved in cell wall biosynthesis